MKPTIHKRKDVRGRKALGYTGVIGAIAGPEAPTPAAAAELAETTVLAAIGRLAAGPKIDTWCGHTYAVYPTVDGWAYWIDTFSNGYGVSASGDRFQVELSAIAHLAQNVWTAEYDDHVLLQDVPPAVRPGLASWIAFQRCYIRIRNAGDIPEAQYHDAACQMSHLYAREHFGAYLARR